MNTYTVRDRFLEYHDSDVSRYSKNQIPAALRRMKEGRMTPDELILTISVRYQVAYFFVDMLQHMIRSIDAGTYREGRCRLDTTAISTLRAAVAQNLNEELGKGGSPYGEPHAESRRLLLENVGIYYREWEKPLGFYYHLGRLHPAAKGMISRMKWTINHGAIEAVAALWYYENRISLGGHGDYHILLLAFERTFPAFAKKSYEQGDVLWHIASHAMHDASHAKLAEEALASVERFGLWRESLELGLEETKKTIDCFWAELSDALFKKPNRP